MNRRQVLGGAAALASCTLLPEWRSGDFGCDEILLIGDSNAYSGLNTDGSAGYNPSIDVPNQFCLESRNAWPSAGKAFTQIALDPFDYNNDGTGGAPVGLAGAIGPGLTFMRDWYLPNLLAPGRNVRVTAQGVGGTGFGDGYWQAPSGLGLTTAVTRINESIAQNARNVLKLILWTSGANDAIGGMSQANYTSYFVAMASYLRANVTGAANVPILVECLVPAWVATNIGTFGPTAAALAALPSSVSKCGYTGTTGITGQTAVPYHLDAPSQRTMAGLFYSQALQNLSP